MKAYEISNLFKSMGFSISERNAQNIYEELGNVENEQFINSVHRLFDGRKTLPVTDTVIKNLKKHIFGGLAKEKQKINKNGCAKCFDGYISVYNQLGEKVRDLINGLIRPPGEFLVVWDGLDNNNELVPAGDYEFHIKIRSLHGLAKRLTKEMKAGVKCIAF